MLRDTQSMTCGDSWRTTRTGRRLATTVGVSATVTEKLGCESPGCKKYFHPRPVPAHRRRNEYQNEYSAGYTGLGGRKVRYLHDVVAGKLFRQWVVGGDLNCILASHDLYLAQSGGWREPRRDFGAIPTL